MINSYLRQELFSDEVVMESLNDMRKAQPKKDQLSYFNVVLEGATETNADIIQKLYTDIIAKSNVDFGSIPDSKGNLIKYKNYPLMQESIDKLNQLFKGRKSEELDITNRLHDMILNCKSDFQVGFTYDVEIVKIMYNVSVVTLYEMVNITILTYTTSMRKEAGIQLSLGKLKKKDSIVLKNAKSLLKSYESGKWGNLMKDIKKNPGQFGNGNESYLAMEAGFGATVATIIKWGAAHKPLVIVAAIIAIFLAIRALIYYFYAGSVMIKDYVETQKEFVNATVNAEKEDGTSEKVVKKHSILAEKLQSIANFIEVKILRTNVKAQEELQKSNTENFHKPQVDAETTGFGGGNITF